MNDGGHVKMAKLSDTQAIILSAAAQRSDGNLLPLPGCLRGGAATKVVGALLARSLAREEVTDRPTRADSALNTVWRNEDDGRAVLLRITPAGFAAIGLEPAADPTGEPETAPDGEAVAYRFNDGTNSAGEPAAGSGAGRGAEEARPPEEGGARSRHRRPRRARPATTPSRRS